MNDMQLATREDSSDRAGPLVDTLLQLDCEVVPAGEYAWECRAGNKRELVSIHLSPHWLDFSRRVGPRPGIQKIESTLRRNNGLPDGVRLVAAQGLQGHQMLLEIPAEVVPWGDPEGLRPLLASCLASMPSRRAAKRPAALAPDSGLRGDGACLAELFDAAGWPLRDDETGRTYIKMDVPGHHLLADVAVDAGSIGLSLVFALSEASAPGSVCRSAVAAFFWQAAAGLRLVRPLLIDRTPAIEVTFPLARMTQEMVTHACTSLQVAAQRLVAEATVLSEDEGLARVYLKQLGFKRLPGD